jgi:hypothetical protein
VLAVVGLHDDPAAHAEVDAERGSGLAVRPGRVAPHRLASPVGSHEPSPDDGLRDVPGSVRAADPLVGVVDGADLAVERGLDRLACAFHFG